jgi:transposase
MRHAVQLSDIAVDLRDQLSAAQQTIESKNHQLQKQKSYIEQLEEFIRNLRQKQFGSSSEAQDTLQSGLFDEGEAERTEETDPAADTVTVAAHARQSRKPDRIPADLPREEIVHDLSDADKVCPHDGSALRLIGADISEQLDIVPAQIKVLRHVRRTYACPCCEQYVVTAKKPKQPIEKSLAAPGLLAHVATQKYVDALPLYRQTEIYRRIGVELDRTTLANWMVACGRLVQPLINLIHDRMMEQAVLHMDETRVQVLNEPGRSAQQHSYMWVMRSIQHPAVLYRYAPSRSGDVARQLLGDYRGALMVDGYEGYSAVCAAQHLTRLGCWAHARRKFVEAQKAQAKGKTGKADQALAFIQALYRIEQLGKDTSPEERHAMRHAQARPIIDKIRQWMEKSIPNTPPQTLLGKALSYVHNQWPHLIRYLDDGQYPIDNNAAENAIRPFVVGRKNWLFSASPSGATASANLYSLIETAKANGIEPYVYLRRVFTDLPNAQCVEQVEALLPWNVKGGVG